MAEVSLGEDTDGLISQLAFRVEADRVETRLARQRELPASSPGVAARFIRFLLAFGFPDRLWDRIEIRFKCGFPVVQVFDRRYDRQYVSDRVEPLLGHHGLEFC